MTKVEMFCLGYTLGFVLGLIVMWVSQSEYINKLEKVASRKGFAEYDSNLKFKWKGDK